MLDPSGEYRFLSNDYFVDGVSNFRDMYITVENGQLVHSSLNHVPIAGVFDDTTGKIDFTLAGAPGVPGLTQHYTGFVILTKQNLVRSMAGTFTRYEITASGTFHVQFAERGWFAISVHP